MATVHLLHGFLGSGKTTFAMQLEAQKPAFRITHDEWMVTLHGTDPPADMFAIYADRVTDLAWDVTRRLIALGQDVILDFGFWSRADRDDARARATACGADHLLYHLDCPEPLMRKRVADRNTAPGGKSLLITENTFDVLQARLDPLDRDEPHITPPHAPELQKG